ncbi:MAG: superoxide dismutase family protein [Betaproteobacteria bacterium]
MKLTPIAAAAAAAFVLAACETTPPEPLRANAGIEPTKGSKTFGEATFEQVGDKVKVVIFVQGLKPGQEHGLHIHEGAACGPDGMAAAGHFNPHGKPHSRHTDANRHAGDLPSLRANKAGRARVEADLDGITVGSGAGNIVGRTIIVHADPDDFRTQPTGNSGARIACGVIKAG